MEISKQNFARKGNTDQQQKLQCRIERSHNCTTFLLFTEAYISNSSLNEMFSHIYSCKSSIANTIFMQVGKS